MFVMPGFFEKLIYGCNKQRMRSSIQFTLSRTEHSVLNSKLDANHPYRHR